LSQFSLVTGFFEGTRENILHIFRALDTIQMTLGKSHVLSCAKLKPKI
jgi:hypothetical protein